MKKQQDNKLDGRICKVSIFEKYSAIDKVFVRLRSVIDKRKSLVSLLTNQKLTRVFPRFLRAGLTYQPPDLIGLIACLCPLCLPTLIASIWVARHLETRSMFFAILVLHHFRGNTRSFSIIYRINLVFSHLF